MKLEKVSDGTLVADGTEQAIAEDIALSKLFGFIDLSEMQNGDNVVVRQYVDLNGGYKLYADESYSDAQLQPAVCITAKGSNKKMKITLQQTAGTYRNFAYEFAREV